MRIYGVTIRGRTGVGRVWKTYDWVRLLNLGIGGSMEVM